MRLWHWKLIPYLPDAQLKGQWSELNSIFSKQDNHRLINYVYEYGKGELYYYTELLLAEREKRGMKTRNYHHMNGFFSEFTIFDFHEWSPQYQIVEPFKKDHTDRYLLECFANLMEKYDRGQPDFSKERYERMKEFVLKELSSSDEIDFWISD